MEHLPDRRWNSDVKRNVNNVIFFSTAVKGPSQPHRDGSHVGRADRDDRHRRSTARTDAGAQPQDGDADSRRRRSDRRRARCRRRHDPRDRRPGRSFGPLLYRFFADREAILDELLEQHCAALDARCVEAGGPGEITCVADLLDREIDLHVHYYRRYPEFGTVVDGRTHLPTVTRHVRARMKALADRLHAILIDTGLIRPTPTRAPCWWPWRWPTAYWNWHFATAPARGRLRRGCPLAIGRRALSAFGRDLSAAPSRHVPS